MAQPVDLLQMSDLELAEKLRRDDPEQYQTLVRMHLSFVLDLNADDCDTACEKSAKPKAVKWGLGTFTKGRKQSTTKGVMEGAPLTQEGICQVYQLIEFLKSEPNIIQEGIFRRSGKMTRQQELKGLLNQGLPLNLEEGKYSVHDCASVLKNFLADLPEPLLTDAHYQAYCQVAEMCSSDMSDGDEPIRLLRALQLLLMLLPTENKALVSDLIMMLNLVASLEDKNKMSADNLSTLFTPHLLCPRKLTPEEFHTNSQLMSRVVSFMIKQGKAMFKVPPKLATDIRAYWAEKENHKAKVAEDHEVVNTVFSFVDRQLTAQANSSNPTEAALAQLYAHIQSLPESAQKRRLVKQFNKENGHGTPLVKKQVNSRSLGDSIKKHIFTKGLKRQKNQDKNSSTDDLLKVSSQEAKAAAPTPSKSTVEMNAAREAPKRRVQIKEESLRVSELDASSPTNPQTEPDTVDHAASSQEGTNPFGSLALTSTPALAQATNLLSSSPIFNTPSLRKAFNKSVSPITRSAQRMPRCMQDAMMTPRSRKPVLVLSSSNLSPLSTPWKDTPSSLLQEHNEEAETSLSSTFKDYLKSRSVLTASPVSLSCNASPEKLSNSLLYCLDGNDPSASTSASYLTSMSNESSSSSGSRKRSIEDSMFADHSISLSSDSAKKSNLESSYSSTLGSSIIRETSL
ncbi:rho GTPase-activating protein 19 isoform X1 [Neocloeon triangulifer]|uniref:rho GTPase-activating protein 19 isoform X1 n=1 Tax=Neocloeon triangulifer TaxID=2078957 RepID=UPI00286ED412|nr:rho GTPase-activating protein 19 isoform X1 [Neocloeon triangulifer]